MFAMMPRPVLTRSGPLVLGAMMTLASSLVAAPDTRAKFVYSNGATGSVAAATSGAWSPQLSCGCAGTSGGPTFNVEFIDVTNDTGMGFDDPVDGATRRATVEAVFDYISTVIHDTGSADFRFNESQFDGTGAIAFAGPFFLDVDGCVDPFTVLHITSGTDPFPGAPDGAATVDFGYTINTGLDDPESDEVDLFSILLHEITHALGFSSSLGSSCAPTCCLPPSEVDTRIRGFDGLLVQGGSGSPLVSCTSGVYAGGDLEGGAGGVRLDGRAVNTVWTDLGNSGSPPLFTPSTFACGASVSHWDRPMDNPLVPAEVVMQPSVIIGQARRVYHPLDVAALADFGYAVGVDPEPCPTDLDGSGTTAFPDLTQLLAAWGPCDGCVADIDGNGEVGFPDLTTLLANWGPCP